MSFIEGTGEMSRDRSNTLPIPKTQNLTSLVTLPPKTEFLAYNRHDCQGWPSG